MPNVLNFIKPQAKLPRNGFDLSQRHIFSAKAGQLLPVSPIECVPGDHIEINVLEMARAVQMKTDAFARIKQNFEFYFVPYTQLWAPFNELISQQHEPYSSALQTTDLNLGVPFCSLGGLLHTIGTFADNDELGFSTKKNALRLLDLLGYGFYRTDIDNEDRVTQLDDVYVNPFRFLAYQKIYADYYRSAYYQEYTLHGQTSWEKSYNVDDLGSIQEADYPRIVDMLSLHYRLWKRDMATGLLPSPQFGSVASVGFSNVLLKATNVPSGSSAINVVAVPSGAGNEKNVQVQGYSNTRFATASAFSVYDLMKAEALQHWRENAARAGHHIKDNFKAHYGVEPFYEKSKLCDFLGAFDSNILIDEVVSTSAGAQSDQLAEIGGKGVGTANGKISFDCKDFGVLMCIYSVVPTAEYTAEGLDKANTLIEHFDFWNPEFDNLGLEPVTFSQFCASNLPITGGAGTLNKLNSVIGYAPRNLYLKTAIDKVHGQFVSLVAETGDQSDFDGVFAHWVTPRINAFNGADPRAQLKQLLVSPAALDNIFYQYATDDDSTDQFLVNCHFDVKAIRNMSVVGLPNW